MQSHFKKQHEAKVNKLEKKLKTKANQSFRPSKKNKVTLQQFKALIVKEKSKYRLLMPRYVEYLKELREDEHQEKLALSRVLDLDIDLTSDKEVQIEELKINYNILVPPDHKYAKQYKIYYDNITKGSIKAVQYERFFLDLLLDGPRCEHCLCPLENSNEAIKHHVSYYHHEIKIHEDKYSYLDVHKYIKEVYRFPYIIYENQQRKPALLCPVPDCGVWFGKVSKVNGQLLVG